MNDDEPIVAPGRGAGLGTAEINRAVLAWFVGIMGVALPGIVVFHVYAHAGDEISLPRSILGAAAFLFGYGAFRTAERLSLPVHAVQHIETVRANAKRRIERTVVGEVATAARRGIEAASDAIVRRAGE